MRYRLRKIGFYLVAAWAAITLNFFLPQLIPGNPVQILLAKMQQSGPVTPGEAQSLKALLGLGKGNILQRYGEYLTNLAHFRLGLSVSFFPVPVSSVLRQAVLWTLLLVGTATVVSFVLGITLGAVVGWRRGTWLDSVVPSTTFLAAIPYFWLALLLLYLLTSKVHVFPQNGGYDPVLDIGWNGAFIGSALKHALLPAITIVLSSVGGWMLGMRNMMVSTLSDDYVVAAEAHGLSSSRVMMGYAARNAVLPSIAGFAISLGFVVSGSLVMEVVFSYPGIGFTLFQAVQNNDYPLMQGVFLLITLAVLGANLIVDLLYGYVDPRTRRA
jgi:peptide/nickel transport system permease protein